MNTSPGPSPFCRMKNSIWQCSGEMPMFRTILETCAIAAAAAIAGALVGVLVS